MLERFIGSGDLLEDDGSDEVGMGFCLLRPLSSFAMSRRELRSFQGISRFPGLSYDTLDYPGPCLDYTANVHRYRTSQLSTVV